MAIFEKLPKESAPTVGSYQTALCIIPPAHLQSQIDSLRALYDKAHGKWPPHINLIYPFVTVENLPSAMDLISSNLRELGTDSERRKINLQMNVQDHFSHRHSNTVFVAPSNNAGGESLKALRGSILEGFKGSEDEREYHPHLTIGQTPANAPSMLEYLLNKARLLLPFEWQVDELVVLVRERMPEKSKMESRMKIWGSINLSLDTAMSVDDSLSFRYPQKMKDKDLDEQEECHALSNYAAHLSGTHRSTQHLRDYSGSKTSSATPGLTYCFCPKNSIWKPVDSSLPLPDSEHIPSSLRISSYNVLHDPSLTLSTADRYPILLQSILSDSALSDVLILQEVSDDFLSYLLSNNTICSYYSFATHTPINPLPSLRNIAVLSRWNFTWEYLSFEHRHKGAVVLQLSNIRISKGESFKPLVVIGVHLSSGLSDSGVAARQSQIQSLMSYLTKKYPTDPWIVAGDFNIATSRAAMEEAVEMKLISAESARTSECLVLLLEENDLVDAWVAAGSDSEIEVYDGDEGATFDPTMNPLAAETVRNAGSKNMHPRRYDRILVKGDDRLEVVEFNMFGLQHARDDEITPLKGKNLEVTHRSGSDHYGIRATLSIGSIPSAGMKQPRLEGQFSQFQLRTAPSSLSDTSTLHACLTARSAFPSEAQVQHRKEVLALLNTILQISNSHSKPLPPSSSSPPNPQARTPTIILLPVGSHALETDLPTSDLDILALSSLRAPSFFSHAVHRLQSSTQVGVKILRKVEAATGTMLELEIRGVRCDLQYCCAPGAISRYVAVVHHLLSRTGSLMHAMAVADRIQMARNQRVRAYGSHFPASNPGITKIKFLPRYRISQACYPA